MKYFTLKYLKNFMEISKYFKIPSLKYFMKFLIFVIKWLKTFKNMIKVCEVSRKYIMPFMHNNRYLPLTGLLTLLQWTIPSAPWKFWNISWNISRQKISWNFTSLDVRTFSFIANLLLIVQVKKNFKIYQYLTKLPSYDHAVMTICCLVSQTAK